MCAESISPKKIAQNIDKLRQKLYVSTLCDRFRKKIKIKISMCVQFFLNDEKKIARGI